MKGESLVPDLPRLVEVAEILQRYIYGLSDSMSLTIARTILEALEPSQSAIGDDSPHRIGFV